MSIVEPPPGTHRLLLEARRRFEFRSAVKQSPRTTSELGTPDPLKDNFGIETHLYVGLSLLGVLEFVLSADLLWAWEAVELDGFEFVAIVGKRVELYKGASE